MCVLGGSGFFGPLSPTTHLIESRLPEPVFPQQQWLACRGHQGAVLIGFAPPGLGPTTLLGTQVEDQREDGSHRHHQQGQILGRRAGVSNGSPRLGGSGASMQPRPTRNTGTSWTPSWSPTLMSWPPCVEPCKCSSSQAMPYTVMLATTVNAYLGVRAGP